MKFSASRSKLTIDRKQVLAYEFLCRERELALWLADVLPAEKASLTGGNLAAALKNGAVLCRVVQRIDGVVLPKFHDPPKFAFHELDNISLILRAIDRLGVPAAHLFSPLDLFESLNWPKVPIPLRIT